MSNGNIYDAFHYSGLNESGSFRMIISSGSFHRFGHVSDDQG